jgi:hypothetical protein
MFMDTLLFDPGKDLVHIGLMDNGPDGNRPDVDGETLQITLPLSQFGPMLHEFADAIDTPDHAEFCRARAEKGPL